jgi:hypothetical protein
MKWTEEKPTQEGFYWFRGLIGDAATGKVHDFRDKLTVVEIIYKEVGFYAKILGAGWWPLIDTANGVWTGPIEPPQG